MNIRKLVPAFLCTTVATACLTIGVAAATPEDHVYRSDYATITNVVSYDENYTASQGGPGMPVNCVAPVKVTPADPDAAYWIENLMGAGQYGEGAEVTEAGIEITEAGEYVLSFDTGVGSGGDGYVGSYYLIVEEEDSAAPSTSGSSVGTFSDVSPDAYYAEAVKWAVDQESLPGPLPPPSLRTIPAPGHRS